MFEFFRRYQRIIYFVVTAVIILSFSFFGTYSAFTSGRGDDPVVLRLVDGTKLTRSEYNDFVHFLSTDCLCSECGFCNALNDGVLSNDIIGTGIGEVLASRFSYDFGKDWKIKFAREKAFQPYRHPQAAFVSALQVWSYFAPDLKEAFQKFSALSTDDPLEIYRKKADLYLAERQFSPNILRQILLHQQQQFNWLEPDIGIENRPLGLFGYSQITDWFGTPFVDKMCEFILQTAAKAREEGMTVSSSEALASLIHNAAQAARRKGNGDGATADELFRRTLQELNIDQSRAVSIWTTVLLFKRALVELPSQIVINDQPFCSQLCKDSQARDCACYQLQPSLQCASLRDVYKIQTWLNGVAPGKANALALPETFLSTEDVSASFPEFVERPFVVNIASVSFDDLVKNIRVRDIWRWEVENGHWDILAKTIPSIAANPTTDPSDRHRVLEALSPQLRAQADMIAKEHIVALHPEWLQAALLAAPKKMVSIRVRIQGPLPALEGIDNRQALIDELMKAPIGEPAKELVGYTQDQKHFYSMQVVARASADQLVPLPDLLADGTLDRVLDRLLEASYPKIRTDRPADYRNDKGEWRPFAEVKAKVADVYFSPLIKNLDGVIDEWKERLPNYCSWADQKSARVAVRFLPHLAGLAAKIQGQSDPNAFITTPFVAESGDKGRSNIETRPLSDLWLLVESKQRILFGDLEEKPQFALAFSQDVGTWLPIRYSKAMGPFVAKIVEKNLDPFEENVRVAVYKCQEGIGREAVRARARQLVAEFFPEPKIG